MRKIIAIMLVALILAVPMVACSDKSSSDGAASYEEPEKAPVEGEETEEPKESSEDTGVVIPMPDGSDQIIGGGGAGGRPITQIPVPSETTQGDLTQMPNMQLAELIKIVRSSEENGVFSIATEETDEIFTFLPDYCGLNVSDFDEYAVSLSPMNVKAYMVAIVKPKAGKTDTVANAFANWTDNKKREFDQYLPDQYAIASSPQMSQSKGGYIVYCMCENAVDICDALIAQVEAKEEFANTNGNLSDTDGNPAVG